MPIPYLVILLVIPVAFAVMVEDYIQYKKGIGKLAKVKLLGGLLLATHFLLLLMLGEAVSRMR